MAKLKLEFEGIDTYLEQLNRLGANIEEETENALMETGETLNRELHEQMKHHHVNGETEK